MEERSYTTIDKSGWGEGPWQEEPDKVQFADEATGLPCLIKRQPSLGHLCGYVGVPPGHPAYEVDYDDVRVPSGDEDGWPVVHGGLTFSDHCRPGPEAEAICHVPAPGEPDDVWWLGFDCAHGGDLAPGMRAALVAAGSALSGYPGDTYRDIEYVRAETARLAQQLAA